MSLKVIGMIIRSTVRGKIDRRFTLFRKEREKLGNISKGDILLLKVKGVALIRKILEDFIISLPRKMPLETNSEIEVEILKHIKPSEGLERPTRKFLNDLVDLKHFIPLSTIHGKSIFVIDDGDKIFVWFPRRGGLKLTHIKRFVDRDSLFELIGFLLGDGSKRNVRSLRFTNCEPSTLNHCINFFQTLGINRNTWKVQIIWSGPEKPPEKLKKECKKFWSIQLDLPIKNIKSVLWSKSKSNKTPNGSARIFIDNAMLVEIFIHGILKWCLEMLEKEILDLDALQPLARGILAAEGCLTFCNDVVRSVNISFNPHSNEEIIFRKILNKLGIFASSTQKNHNEFPIRGWDNFLKLFVLDAFKLHKNMNEKFIKGFRNHKSTIFRLKILSNLSKGIPIPIHNRNKIMERLKRSRLVIKNNEGISLTELAQSFLKRCNSL